MSRRCRANGLTAELSVREVECLLGVARGMTNAEIGQELGLAEDTIKTHMRRIFDKLGARDRAHAVNNAWERGVLGADQAGNRQVAS